MSERTENAFHPTLIRIAREHLAEGERQAMSAEGSAHRIVYQLIKDYMFQCLTRRVAALPDDGFEAAFARSRMEPEELFEWMCEQYGGGTQ